MTPLELALQRERLKRRASMGMAGLGQIPGLPQVSPGLLQQAVRSVTLRTQVSPPVRYAPGEAQPASSGSGVTDWILSTVIRPQIDFETPLGTVTTAPYGPPSVNLYPWLVGGTILAGIGLGWLVVRGMRRRNPRRLRWAI